LQYWQLNKSDPQIKQILDEALAVPANRLGIPSVRHPFFFFKQNKKKKLRNEFHNNRLNMLNPH